MHCIIPGVNLKVFGKAIHSLSKIGEEIYFEALINGLAVRTVNSSRSAFFSFHFNVNFFEKYSSLVKGMGANNNTRSNVQSDNGDDGDPNDYGRNGGDDNMRCKVNVKSILSVFKSLNSLEKSVERCKIKLDLEMDKLIFKLNCKHGLVKTYNLSFIECEALEALFLVDSVPNILCSQSKLLSEITSNFHQNIDELSLFIDNSHIVIKNYVSPSEIGKSVRTEISLKKEEFEMFQCQLITEITFCFKEIKAILSFSEIGNLPIRIYFDKPGLPLVFTIDEDVTFKADFVLATMSDRNNPDNNDASTNCQSTNTKEHSKQTKNKVAKGKAKNAVTNTTEDEVNLARIENRDDYELMAGETNEPRNEIIDRNREGEDLEENEEENKITIIDETSIMVNNSMISNSGQLARETMRFIAAGNENSIDQDPVVNRNNNLNPTLKKNDVKSKKKYLNAWMNNGTYSAEDENNKLSHINNGVNNNNPENGNKKKNFNHSEEDSVNQITDKDQPINEMYKAKIVTFVDSQRAANLKRGLINKETGPNENLPSYSRVTETTNSNKQPTDINKTASDFNNYSKVGQNSNFSATHSNNNNINANINMIKPACPKNEIMSLQRKNEHRSTSYTIISNDENDYTLDDETRDELTLTETKICDKENEQICKVDPSSYSNNKKKQAGVFFSIIEDEEENEEVEEVVIDENALNDHKNNVNKYGKNLPEKVELKRQRSGKTVLFNDSVLSSNKKEIKNNVRINNNNNNKNNNNNNKTDTNELSCERVPDSSDDDIPVPGTPPQKKFRSLLFGQSQSLKSQKTILSQKFMHSQTPQVLAEDSEVE